MADLARRIALVSGASSGVGLATVTALAAAGARVIAAARRTEPLAALAAGGSVLPVALDVRDHDAVLAAIAGLPSEWRPVDILVNNAGVRTGSEKFQESDAADIDAMIDTNLRGLLNVTHAVLPEMISAGRGHIVNIGSNSVRFPYATGAVYTATKAATESLSTGLRIDLAGTGIRTTHIHLGLTKTDISLVRFGGDREKAEAHYAGRPALDPEEVAECILWIVSRPGNIDIADLRLLPAGQSGASQ